MASDIIEIRVAEVRLSTKVGVMFTSQQRRRRYEDASDDG